MESSVVREKRLLPSLSSTAKQRQKQIGLLLSLRLLTSVNVNVRCVLCKLLEHVASLQTIAEALFGVAMVHAHTSKCAKVYMVCARYYSEC